MKMKQTILTLCTCLSSFSLLQAATSIKRDTNGEITPVIRYYQGINQINELTLNAQNGAQATDTQGAEWKLSMDTKPIEGEPDAREYALTFTLQKGEAQEVVVGVEFPFKEWNSANYVFVPAIVYDGNRFDIKDIGYPPYWYDKKEWRLDMPVTTTVQPTLGKTGSGAGKIELTTANATTPLMAFHAPSGQQAWMVLTTQGSSLGNHGLTIEENDDKSEARFAITAPAVRQKRAVGAGFADSGDQAANWKQGESVTIRFRLYSFKAPTLQDMMTRFTEVRKDLNTAVRRESIPFSEAWKLINNLYQTERWDEKINLFCLSKPGTGTSWNFIWQLGWCGGGQCTLPLMMQGEADVRARAKRNLDVIFSKSQAESGFYNAYGNGNEFAGFGYFKPLENDETFVRSQGDWLYMAQRQFHVIESAGETVPAHWRAGLRKQADAFLKLWNTYNQFGQFINVKTGDICIGSSAAGAIVPAGLALASKTYNKKEYLVAAKEAGRKFYKDFVLKGYTTGGPGEILSTPDSESAFGLFEAFMTLYEVTEDKEWIRYASDLLPICASWTVSYDFCFPSQSEMDKIDARSCGSVWASVANKHSAPGICTWSGDSFLKYYRASGDKRALELITDIAHGLPQYMSRADQRVGTMSPGGLCERVNMSDWEGKEGVGGNIFGSCSWVEAAAAMTTVQLPGIYAQPDKGIYAVLDNIEAEDISDKKGELKLKLTNPTQFAADVKIFSETSRSARKPIVSLVSGGMPVIHLEPNETKEMKL